MSHVAASAFGHCMVLVRDAEAATSLAGLAARRGGRSLGAVLGHARHQSLLHLADHPAPPAALDPGAGPAEVAWNLAWTRPPAELAVVDAASRYGLSRAGLGMALRLAPGAAAARVEAVNRAWDAELDPALLAWMGPGECGELAELLDGGPARTPAELLAQGTDVSAHLPACETCADRRRAMASVRQLLAGTPLPAPPASVIAAASGSRIQPPLPPPALTPRPGRTGRRAVLIAAAVAVLAGGTALAVAATVGGDDGPDGLQALIRVPAPTGSLALDPATLELPARQVSLANRSGADVDWRAGSDVPWLHVTPAEGRLEAGGSQMLSLDGEAPEGDVRASVRVSGDDGSAAAVTLGGTVERPPDLGATAEGCRVTAVVEDESDVLLTLHWRSAGGEQTSSMVADDTGQIAELPEGTPLTWWVSARDGRGNQARTPDVAVAEGC